MEDNITNNGSSRRKFLAYGLAGVGSLIGGRLLAGGLSDEEKMGPDIEKIKVLTTDGKVIEVEREKTRECHGGCEPAVGKEARKGLPNKKFVMVIDLGRCKNARKCIEACQHGHQLRPDQEFIKVLKMQDSKDTAPYWFPKPCYHCNNASCVDVCPVDATYTRSDNVVLVDSEKCIGCKYCMVACPYSARIFNWRKPELDEKTAAMEYSPETQVPPKAGTVSKCDFCPDLAREGKLPYCASSCPMGAIYFGDANEDAVFNGSETVKFSDLVRDKAAYKYLEYFGTDPNVYYIPPVNRLFPFEEGLPKEEEENS